MRSEIQKIFDAEIDRVFEAKPDIAKFLKSHPKRNLCLDNLCEQVKECERRTFQITFDADAYRDVINSVCRMFAHAALSQREQQLLSESEKLRLRAEAERDQYVEEAIEEMKKDGLIIDGEAKLKEHDGKPTQEAEKEGLVLKP